MGESARPLSYAMRRAHPVRRCTPRVPYGEHWLILIGAVPMAVAVCESMRSAAACADGSYEWSQMANSKSTGVLRSPQPSGAPVR